MPAPTNTVPALAGYGATVLHAVDGTTYVDTAYLKDVTPPTRKKSVPKVSCLVSPGQVHEFFAGGWADPGELKLMAYFTKAQYVLLLAIAQATTIYNWKIVFGKLAGETTGSTFVFAGILMELGVDQLSVEDDNLIMMPITIKVTGEIVFTSGS